MRTFTEVGIKYGLEDRTLERYVLYMTERWGKTEELECGSGYASEWANRFRTGVEYGCSDSIGQVVLRKIDGEKKKEKRNAVN